MAMVASFFLLSCKIIIINFLVTTYFTSSADAEDVDKGALMKVFSLMQHCDPRDSFIYVAAAGDVPTLKRCLEKHPDEVLYSHIYIHVHVCTNNLALFPGSLNHACTSIAGENKN